MPVKSFLFRLARRLFRLLRGPYYRWLYGRSFPGSATLGRVFRRLERRFSGGDVPLSPEEWDRQYDRDEWGFLEQPDELARYAVLAAAVRRLAPGGRVLDVGCGEGMLLEELVVGEYGEYVGIDLSEVAVARGRKRNVPRARFLVADAESWRPENPEARFDAIVLNECVYYFETPEETVGSYLDLLAPQGLLVISMFHSPRTRAIRRTLARWTPPSEEIELHHRKGAWTISLHAARDRPPKERQPV